MRPPRTSPETTVPQQQDMQQVHNAHGANQRSRVLLQGMREDMEQVGGGLGGGGGGLQCPRHPAGRRRQVPTNPAPGWVGLYTCTSHAFAVCLCVHVTSPVVLVSEGCPQPPPPAQRRALLCTLGPLGCCCVSTVLGSRDLNGARNIMAVFTQHVLDGTRPAHLRRPGKGKAVVPVPAAAAAAPGTAAPAPAPGNPPPCPLAPQGICTCGWVGGWGCCYGGAHPLPCT
jgi:hypothetical protein